MNRELVDSGVEWIGKIPSNWEIRKLSSIAKRITDYVASGSFATIKKNVTYLDKPDYAMLIRTADLSQKTNKEPVYINKHSYEFLSNSNLFGGELILPNIGSVGEVYYYEPMYERASLAPNAILVDMKGSNRFYYYFFKNPLIGDALKNLGNDSVQAKFNKTQLRQLKVLNPPFEEQKKIANFLDEKVSQINLIIRNTKQSIEELNKYKQSIITETVTKGLNPNVEMKYSGLEWLGYIPKHWNLTKIKNIFEIKKVIANKLGFDVLSVTQQGLKIKDIESNEGQLSSDYTKYQIVEKNDFVMNHMDLLTGWVDCSKYIGVTSPDYRVFKFKKVNEEYCHDYFKYLLQSCYFNKVFYGFGQGVSNFGRWRLQTNAFLNFYFPVPDIKEQYEISMFLNEKCAGIDSIIAKKEKLLAEMESYKKSLIYEYVTGKKEVL
jgi:type I restriction enzyme, S subunit